MDAPRGGGKIPIMPNYLVSAADDAVVLRNYEGMLVRYNPTGDPPRPRPPVETLGVSGLLEGQAEALIPEGNPRHKRRKALPPLLDPANIKPGKTHVNGSLNGNGHAHANGNGNGHANGNGNGHANGNGQGRPPR